MLAVSLNLTVGILGELSLGHAGFMSVGAFSAMCFSVYMEDVLTTPVRFALALLIGGIAAGIAGVLIGIPVLRLQGDYLAIVTLAFGEIIKNVLNATYLGIDGSGIHVSLKDAASMNLAADGKVIINGPLGITNTPKDATFTVGILLILFTLFIVLNLIKSRTGRAIMSIRDNRIAAESVGINVTKYKLIAFSVSAALAGVAGAFYAHNFSSLVAQKFDYNTSILILVFVVLGGIGNIRGSVIAAAVLTVLPEMLRALNTYRMLIYAVDFDFGDDFQPERAAGALAHAPETPSDGGVWRAPQKGGVRAWRCWKFRTLALRLAACRQWKKWTSPWKRALCAA